MSTIAEQIESLQAAAIADAKIYADENPGEIYLSSSDWDCEAYAMVSAENSYDSWDIYRETLHGEIARLRGEYWRAKEPNNIAERIAALVDGDGQKFSADFEEALLDACQYPGRSLDERQMTRYIFEDGSIIIVQEGLCWDFGYLRCRSCWDFGYLYCFCMREAGHQDCPDATQE